MLQNSVYSRMKVLKTLSITPCINAYETLRNHNSRIKRMFHQKSVKTLEMVKKTKRLSEFRQMSKQD